MGLDTEKEIIINPLTLALPLRGDNAPAFGTPSYFKRGKGELTSLP
jgi:hypothetical protein